MVPFDLDVKVENKALTISVKQLDLLADEEGYLRYNIHTGDRRGVIYVERGDQLPAMTPDNFDSFYEAIHYPEQVPFFSNDEQFTDIEVRSIGNAIRHYKWRFKFMFNRFMSRA